MAPLSGPSAQSASVIETAKAMIQRYGFQAPAIAREHLSEQRLSGNTAGLERWQAVTTAIDELRQSPRQPVRPGRA